MDEVIIKQKLLKTSAEERLIVAAIALVEKLGLKGGETWEAVQVVKAERNNEQIK